MVGFAVRHEWARTATDVLARRSRMLFLDAKTALERVDAVAAVLAQETVARARADESKALARPYLDCGG